METTSRDCVFLLHGIAKTGRDMRAIEKSIQKEGWDTVNLHYPSRRYSIAKLTSDYLAPAVDLCRQNHNARIHFVVHSMGGYFVNFSLAKLSD